jgi:hypothetical protein
MPAQQFETVSTTATSNRLQAQVGTVESGDDHEWITQSKVDRDVAANVRRRGGGEGPDRRAAARFERGTDEPVVRSEVMAPRGDAVRLVDDESTYRERRQPRHESGPAESLRSDIEQLKVAP